MKTGLILVDIQNDYFPGGRMELAGIAEASARAAALLARFRDQGLPTFHIQHVFQAPDAPFFVRGTDGVEIHESIAPRAGEIVVEKHYPNSFRESALLDAIRGAGVERLVICGAMSHMCIDATTRHAVDIGLPCTLIHDACATRDVAFEGRTIPAHEVHGAFMSALGWGYAKLETAEAFLGRPGE
jgi:nicotinamidase-related amidase